MSTRLILIRHAETDWNRQRKYCSFSDIGLNENGRKQARKLHGQLSKEKISRVYSSDMLRAIQTAKAAILRKTIKKLPGLREINFGVFEGLTYRKIMNRYPKIYKKWLNDPYSFIIPEGENLSILKKRILSAFKKIVALNHNKTVAVVCHGGSISIFITHILKTKDFWRYIPPSASISIIEYKNGKPNIQLLNDNSHLS